MIIKETITQERDTDNAQIINANGTDFVAIVERDPEVCIDNPIEYCGLNIAIDLGRRNGGVTYYGNGDFCNLYDYIMEKENNNPAFTGANSPIDCGYEIDSNGDYILDADGYRIDNPRYIYSGEANTDYPEELGKLIKIAQDNGVLFEEIYVYQHTLVRYSTSPFSDPWDSARDGLAWITPEDLKENFGNDADAWRKAVTTAMDDLTDWSNGEVYALGYAQCKYDADKDAATVTSDFQWIGGFIGYQHALDSVKEYLPA